MGRERGPSQARPEIRTMSEKKPDAAPPAEAAPAPEKKKGLPIKTIAVVAVLMLVEAGAVIFVFGMMGGPKQSKADIDPKQLQHDESNEIQEIQVIDDRFQNHSSGKVWVWDINLVVQVKNKNADRIQKVLEQRKAEVQEGISQIISRAQHAQLKEPERQSISRQLSAFLEKVLGNDADGKSVVERLIIPKCRGYPADF